MKKIYEKPLIIIINYQAFDLLISGGTIIDVGNKLNVKNEFLPE